MIDAVQKIKEASFTGSDGLDYVETLVALDALKSVSEQEPREDCISRQAVLDLVKKNGIYTIMCKAINELPPVTPQPKTGHWIRMKSYEKWRCSECDTVFRFTFKEHDYCPKCGAKMIEPQESEGEE